MRLSRPPLWFAAAFVVLACGGAAGSGAGEIVPPTVEAVARFNWVASAPPDEPAPAEISGVTPAGGDRYLAVADGRAALLPLEISVDPSTGRVRRAGFGAAVPLTGPGAGLSDREAVACEPGCRAIRVAGEGPAHRPGPWLAAHAPDGSTLEITDLSHPALAALATARANFGFESLARRPDGGWWAATEEAVAADGPRADPERGSTVRLLRFGPAMEPVAQFAYRTDPVPGPVGSPAVAVGLERSGLVDLLVLPDGTLLALERALGGDPSGMAGFRIRLYRVDVSDATDVSAPPFRAGLAGGDWTPAGKTLLLELQLGLPVSNFEAMALGPTLEDGGRSLLLFADNGGGARQSIYALRIRPADPGAGPR